MQCMATNNKLYERILSKFSLNLAGWVVQRWIRVNPGLNKNYTSNCLSKEDIKVLIENWSDFLLKKKTCY